MKLSISNAILVASVALGQSIKKAINEALVDYPKFQIKDKEQKEGTENPLSIETKIFKVEQVEEGINLEIKDVFIYSLINFIDTHKAPAIKLCTSYLTFVADLEKPLTEFSKQWKEEPSNDYNMTQRTGHYVNGLFLVPTSKIASCVTVEGKPINVLSMKVSFKGFSYNVTRSTIGDILKSVNTFNEVIEVSKLGEHYNLPQEVVDALRFHYLVNN